MGNVRWNDSALKKAVGAAARAEVAARTRKAAAAANSMSAGYRTGLYHRDHESPAVGGTAPRYEPDVRDYDGWPVGIVYTGNYAAMKDNHENNTLLKAKG
ncbi:MAG: hypothetical protein IJ087_14790 [Eggerthellaceae bacterium]|nr:hypothetical protein [Eggerthellaceae bacterium]